MANAAFLRALRIRQTSAPKKRSPRLRKPPVWQHPAGLERDYERRLLSMVAILEREIEMCVIEALPSLAREASQIRPDRLDDFVDRLASLLRATRAVFIAESPDLDTLALQVAMNVSAFNKEQERRILQSVLGVDAIGSEGWLRDQLRLFASENARLIKSIPEQLLGDVEGIVQRGMASGTRPEELAKAVRERFGVSKSRARLIARDQVAKLNANLTELRQRDLGVGRYIWRTSRDERVRDSHRAKAGKIFEWSNPPSDTGHPGQDFQCRCYAEPLLQDLVEASNG